MNNGLYIRENTLNNVRKVIARRSNSFDEAVSLVLLEGEPADAIVSWSDVIVRAAGMDRRTFNLVFHLFANAQSAATLESFCFHNQIR